MPRQRIAVGLVILMVWSGFTSAGCNTTSTTTAARGDVPAPAGASAPAAQAPAATPLLPPAPPSDIRDASQRLASATPKSAFDVDLKAAELGPDINRLFAFVRNDVRTEIYAGELRGARGTLIARAGNAWDKAALLADLLRHHGREVRFARGRLAPDRAAAQVARMFDEANRPSKAAPIALPDAVLAQGRALQARIESRWRRAHADLLAALDRGGVALGKSAPVPDAVLIDEASDHAWIEYRDGDRWIALDPAGAAQPGESAATPAETFAQIPDALTHRVTLRVKVEERRNQAVTEREAFVWTTTAAALHGANIVLAHRMDRTPLGRWLATPVLFVDGRAYGALAFSDAGLDVAAKTSDGLVADASKQVQGVGAVSGLFGQAAQPPTQPPAGGELTAVSLEVEFVDPSGHSDVVRRPLLDRLGADARKTKKEGTAPAAPLTVVDNVPRELGVLYGLAVTSGALDPSMVAAHVAPSLGVVDDSTALRALSPGQSQLPPDARARLKRVAESLPTVLSGAAQTFHVLSQRLAARVAPSDGTLLWYEAFPRVVIVSADPAAPAPSIDLRRNALRVVARNVPGDAIVRANLARGVLDGVIEDALVESSLAGVRSAVSVSTVAILDRAREQNIAVVSRADGRHVTVLPERSPSVGGSARSGWWQIDPATGETIGVLDNGLHGAQSWSEQAAINRAIAQPAARVIVAAPSAEQAYWAGYTAGAADAGSFNSGVVAGGLVGVIMVVLGATVAFLTIDKWGK